MNQLPRYLFNTLYNQYQATSFNIKTVITKKQVYISETNIKAKNTKLSPH